MWIFIWLVITVFIVGVSLWSYLILREQKQAWKKFANKHKFTYSAGKMMDSPSMTGRFEGYILNLYTDTQSTNDMRGYRYVTVVEIEMGQGVPAKAAVGTNKTKEFVNQLALTKDVIFDHEKWSGDYVARTDNKKRLKAYFTKTRLDTLVSLFAMKGTTVLYFCDEIDAVIRIETNDPLRNSEKMERIMKRLVRDIEILAPTSEEKELLPKRKKSSYADEEDDDDEDDYDPVAYVEPVTEDADEGDTDDGGADSADSAVATAAKEIKAPLKPKKETAKKSKSAK